MSETNCTCDSKGYFPHCTECYRRHLCLEEVEAEKKAEAEAKKAKEDEQPD